MLNQIYSFLHQARLLERRSSGQMRRLPKYSFGRRQHWMVLRHSSQRRNNALRQNQKNSRSYCYRQVSVNGFPARLIKQKDQGTPVSRRIADVYCFYIINFHNNHMMQVMATPPLDRQKRSLSYNDLKRKRLMRSAQSHKKLSSGQEQWTIKKGMSEAKTILSSIPRDERVIEGCIEELKGVLGSLKSRSSKKRIISIRENMTERPSIKQSIEADEVKVAQMWNKVQETGETKQLIKHLLNKNRSQRKLVKFNEIRDKLKEVKERSISNERSIIKPIPSPMKELKEKTIVYPQSRVGKDINNKSTQPFLKVSSVCLQQQLQKLQKCSSEQLNQIWADQIKGKENEEVSNSNLNIPDISSIKTSQNDRFNQSELKLLQTTDSNPSKIGQQGSFLCLLKDDLRGGKCVKGRQARRRGQLEKVKRIFPSGFFDN